MNNKKLFAILTLVAFMMTLMPVAAFAAVADYSAAASSIKVTNTSPDVYDAEADDITDNMAKVTITFKDGENEDVADKEVTFYLKSTRDAEVGFIDALDGESNGEQDEDEDELDSDELASEKGQGFTATTDADGEVVFYIGSGITGEFTIKVYNEDNADDGLLLGSETIDVAVGDGEPTLTVRDEEKDTIDDGDDFAYEGKGTEAEPFEVTAGDGLELKAVVEDGNVAIEDEEVVFQVSYEGGSYDTLATDVSDEDGEAYYYFEETKAGDYKYRAKVDDEKSDAIYVTVIADDVDQVSLKDKESGAKVGTDTENTITFLVTDKYDNKIDAETANVLNVEITSAPSNSNMEDDEEELDVSEDAGEVDWKFEPDEDGAYTIKATLLDSKGEETRDTYTFTLNAVEFDDISDMKLTIKNTAGDTVSAIKYTEEEDDAVEAGYIKIEVLNEDGVKITLPAGDADDYTVASSDNDNVTVKMDGNKAQLTVVDEDFIGDVTITIVNTDDKVTESIVVPVVGEPVAIVPTVDVDGKIATVDLQLVDAAGNNTFEMYDGDATEEAFDVIVSGLTYLDVDNIDEAGQGSFELKASEYGTYDVTVVTDETHVAATFQVEFEAPATEQPVIGAENVTMFIGSTGYVVDGSAAVADVAPFIQDGRTFVPVRMVSEALGAEVEWDAATQTVTLTREDKTITMTIGSNVLVVSDGTTVVADVAPFIKDGRTVLPFRAIGEAFGATVDAVFAADGTVSAVTFAQ